jgi:hypothetical protein
MGEVRGVNPDGLALSVGLKKYFSQATGPARKLAIL